MCKGAGWSAQPPDDPSAVNSMLGGHQPINEGTPERRHRGNTRPESPPKGAINSFMQTPNTAGSKDTQE